MNKPPKEVKRVTARAAAVCGERQVGAIKKDLLFKLSMEDVTNFKKSLRVWVHNRLKDIRSRYKGDGRPGLRF